MRTETTTRTLYLFDELTDSIKEKARDWYRQGIGEDPFWSECVIDSAQDAGKLLGITFDRPRGRNSGVAVYWSGFSSQGDGACFEGSWSAADVKPGKLANEFTGDDRNSVELRRIAAEFERIAAAYPGASFSVKHRGHYSHEGCTSFEIDAGEPPEGTARADFREDDLIEAARDFMRWIYRSLETEWEYQYSDECVDESIRANGYEFTEAGERA